jgi:hypothetical protein
MIDISAVLRQPEEQKEDDHYRPPDLEASLEDDDEPLPPAGADLATDLAVGAPAAGPAGQPLAATFLRRFTAVHTSGTRPLSAITHIVLHSTEGDTAAAAASWFANAASGGSSQLIVDDRECYRTPDNSRIPWGAPGTNVSRRRLS